MSTNGTLDQREFLIRKKFFTLAGAKFHVYDAADNLVLFSKQKAFKLKEDIRIYADESMTSEQLVIQARQIVDFGAAYDVIDAPTGQKIGMLRRKGFKSLLRDSWEFCDENDQLVAQLEEDSMLLAVVRRFLTNLVPQKFTVKVGEQTVVTYQQKFNPFIQKLVIRFEDELGGVNPHLAIAAGILLVAIESRQN